MSNIILIEAGKEKKQICLEHLFNDFREKMIKAQTSLDFKDGLAAGRAWKLFLDGMNE